MNFYHEATDTIQTVEMHPQIECWFRNLYIHWRIDPKTKMLHLYDPEVRFEAEFPGDTQIKDAIQTLYLMGAAPHGSV